MDQSRGTRVTMSDTGGDLLCRTTTSGITGKGLSSLLTRGGMAIVITAEARGTDPMMGDSVAEVEGGMMILLEAAASSSKAEGR